MQMYIKRNNKINTNSMKTLAQHINEALKIDVTFEGLINNIKQVAEKFDVFHHNTTSYEQHIAFGEIYNEYYAMKDDIIEKMMGYANKRYDSSNIGKIEYTDKTGKELSDDLKNLGDALVKFANDNNYADIEGMGQEISGLGAKLNYLLTLK